MDRVSGLCQSARKVDPQSASKTDPFINYSSQRLRTPVDEDDKLHWLERVDGKVVRHDVEPGTTRFRRASIAVLSWLSIEWLL